MIFSNYPFLLSGIFIALIALQYVRYRRIGAKYISISGMLLIKLIVRILAFALFLVASKSFFINSLYEKSSSKQALLVIKSSNPKGFRLSEDDQINILTRIPSAKYESIQICLFNPNTNQYYQFIPPTSEKSFFHLISIERPLNRTLQLVNSIYLNTLKPVNRVEYYENANNAWQINESNQDNFNLFEFLSEENSSMRPFLLQYLLILIIALLSIDIGIKYRILKF